MYRSAISLNGCSPWLIKGCCYEKDRYLGLAISLGEYAPPASTVRRFYRLALRLGRRCADRVLVPLNARGPSVPPQRRRRRARLKPNESIGRRRRLTQSHFAITDNGDIEIRILSAKLTQT